MGRRRDFIDGGECKGLLRSSSGYACSPSSQVHTLTSRTATFRLTPLPPRRRLCRNHPKRSRKISIRNAEKQRVFLDEPLKAYRLVKVGKRKGACHEYPFQAQWGIVPESLGQGISGTGVFGEPEGAASSPRSAA